MRRSITRVIIAVTTATVVALGVPLAIAVARAFQGDAVVHLQRRAALAVGEVTLPLDPVTLAASLSEPDDPAGVTIYDNTGTRLLGPGPAIADAAVREALRGVPAARTIDASVVVATPLNDRGTETVVGAVRVTTLRSTVWARTARAWVVMAAVAAAALLAAWAAARRQGARLAKPVNQLATTAALVGTGRLTPAPESTGIAEIDAVASALHTSATQLVELLARERAFTSDVSHQLRTPLTRLRLAVERDHADLDLARAALTELDQIDHTIDHLLQLARGRRAPPEVTDLTAAAQDATRRWQPIAQNQGRTLDIAAPEEPTPVPATGAAVDQVLDVLIDNALRHGRGTISIVVRHAPGAIAIEVTNQGPSVGPDDAQQVFQRNEHNGHGIGLSLAQTLVAADGGRLSLLEATDTTFQVIYADMDGATNDDQVVGVVPVRHAKETDANGAK